MYTDEPLEFGDEVEDFLPPPEVLAKASRKVIVKISLDAETLVLLKQIASQQKLSHQEVIEKLLKRYVQRRKNHNNFVLEAVAG